MKICNNILLGVLVVGTLLLGFNLNAEDMPNKFGGHPKKFEFPPYPKFERNKNLRFLPDSLGNRITEDHLKRIELANTRTNDLMKKNHHVTEAVRVGRVKFSNLYRPEFEHRSPVFDAALQRFNMHIVSHPKIINSWNSHYFYGGFHYGFHPIHDIDVYFYNPLVYWFYVRNFDEQYYRNWYTAEYDAYPQLHTPFMYAGLYYPTENLRQLLFGVSAMTVQKQIHFREGVSLFTKKLAQSLANSFGSRIRLTTGDIVVSHYEVLGYDEAIVLEGLVTAAGKDYNYKGLIDLRNPGMTVVFAPASLDVAPTAAQIHSLDQLNAKIAEIKGEPTPVAPVLMATPEETPGEVTAEPEH
jgi:hypothetical protein